MRPPPPATKSDMGTRMSRIIELHPRPRWVELTTTASDWDQADETLLETMLVAMVLIRTFEQAVLTIAGQGLVHGPAHSAIGQEGSGVGSILALRPSDQINGSHRAHHQFLAKSLQYLFPQGLSARAPFHPQVHELVKRTLSEILGLAAGFCRGRGGSMHLRWREAGNLGTNAIVGGGVPFAAGAAWCHRRAALGDVAVTYFGDGAMNIGAVLETMNLAAAWRLPLCFFVENNQYAVATTVDESTAEPRLSARGGAFNIPAWRVDGMDPLAVHLATRAALEEMRAGHGPTLIEAQVYRYYHQNGPLPGSAFGYRKKQEETEWRARDPIDRVLIEMRRRALIDDQVETGLRNRTKSLLDEVLGELLGGDGNQRRIYESLWPDASFRDVGIRSNLSELAGVRTAELESYEGRLVEARFIDVVAEVMRRRMAEDDRIVVLGEDVHRLKGGTNGATRGLKELFDDRVLGTPICENAFVGLAGGMAMDGRYIPVVEFMYPDFLWVSADQLFNQIGKARHMFGGDIDMPLVLRTKVAMGTGYGSQHSMDPVGIFATSVGWRIVAPATAFDYVGLMNTALRARDPVLVVEHVDLYSQKEPAPADDFDYFIPFGKAKVRQAGKQLTVLTYLSMVRVVLAVVARLSLDVEVIDLRSLDRASIDWSTIEASAKKTGRVLIVEQGSLGPSYGTMLAADVATRCFQVLRAPVGRVLGGEAQPSVSRLLESAACAGSQEVEAGLLKMLSCDQRVNEPADSG